MTIQAQKQLSAPVLIIVSKCFDMYTSEYSERTKLIRVRAFVTELVGLVLVEMVRLRPVAIFLLRPQ